MGENREVSVFLAKLAEQAERYDEMVSVHGLIGEVWLLCALPCDRPPRSGPSGIIPLF
jgi:hypothetical protein